ncbi:zinc finger matrin-type protein 2-like [Chironomus tepperi]|uniref:zinc finger matrin-type protein 2-like n=1 Tax=Chironomus tepperi TaxID=113505 RepID=UPI00391F6E1D
MYKKESESKKKQKEVPKNITKNKLDFDLKAKLKIGKVNIVNPKLLRNEFYCSVCDVLKHDSLSYQSHITSKAHMKNIGKDLTIAKSSLDQVRSRLNGKTAVSSSKKNPGIVMKPTVFKKHKQKVKKEEPMSAEQAEIFQTMGFNYFGRIGSPKQA